MTVADELQARALFEQRYGAAAAPVAVEIERRVIGGDWGANGYTTIAQADQLAAGLQLSAANRLLDIGTGRGWPGLYLAARSGCRVVLADLPLEGLRVAAARAQTEALAARSSVLVAAASAPLPRRQLRRHHPHRRAVLTARQALRAESLQAAPWARAGARASPRSSKPRACHPRRGGGHAPPVPEPSPRAATTIGCSARPASGTSPNSTSRPAFRATATAWLAESESHTVELARLEPPGAFPQRQADRRAMLAAIDTGLLRRALLLARRG